MLSHLDDLGLQSRVQVELLLLGFLTEHWLVVDVVCEVVVERDDVRPRRVELSVDRVLLPILEQNPSFDECHHVVLEYFFTNGGPVGEFSQVEFVLSVVEHEHDGLHRPTHHPDCLHLPLLLQDQRPLEQVQTDRDLVEFGQVLLQEQVVNRLQLGNIHDRIQTVVSVVIEQRLVKQSYLEVDVLQTNLVFFFAIEQQILKRLGETFGVVVILE